MDYESEQARDEYLAFHYPGEDPLRALIGERAPPLAERYPFSVRALWDAAPAALALDVGCACGRVTFDLARDHRAAVGVDRSRALVGAAAAVRASGRARYTTLVSGDVRAAADVPVETAPNARFAIGDALALPFRDGAFATVVALNLIDRVPDPAQALREAARVTAPRGVLLVGSPYTWLEAFTPRARWLDGPEGVRAVLGAAFRCEREVGLPFFIPHHERSGQLAVSLVQRFRRIS